MAQIICAISGIKLSIPHVPMYLTPDAGYVHPIFHLKQKYLWNLYKRHCSGKLTSTDSYLLFLALLHSTDQVSFSSPAFLLPEHPSTIKLVESNIRQLVDTIQLTNTIRLPSFKQPSFIVSTDTASLQQVPNWIAAWIDNVDTFRSGTRSQRLQESLQKTENRLSYFIRSGSPTESYSHVVASWAAKAASFPPKKADYYIKTIRSCFNSAKIFSIPLADIREIKTYCENNIPVGSIHFHTLMEVLKEGISRHTDFLGMHPVALGYTLVDVDTTVNDAKVEEIVAAAPTAPPTILTHPNSLDLLRAKLAYSVAQHRAVTEIEPEASDTETNNLTETTGDL